MQNDRNVLVWVGCNNPETRELIQDAIENQLANYEENMDTLKVVGSPLRAPSLMEVIDDYKPGFFNSIVNEVADLAVFTVKTMGAAAQSASHELMTNPQDQLEQVGQTASHFFGTTVDFAGRIAQANDLIVSGALTDGPEHKQYYLNQALRILNGDRYPDIVKGITEKEIAETDNKFWEWDQGMAP